MVGGLLPSHTGDAAATEVACLEVIVGITEVICCCCIAAELEDESNLLITNSLDILVFRVVDLMHVTVVDGSTEAFGRLELPITLQKADLFDGCSTIALMGTFGEYEEGALIYIVHGVVELDSAGISVLTNDWNENDEVSTLVEIVADSGWGGGGAVASSVSLIGK